MALFKGLFAALGLLIIYFLLVSWISGSAFALSQFQRYWYFILALSIGFGIQIGLYDTLRHKVKKASSGKAVVAVTGSTSTIAMVSCCSHYLVNLLPVLGAVGVLTIISQYQTQLFWVGIVANFLGILFLVNRLRKISIS